MSRFVRSLLEERRALAESSDYVFPSRAGNRCVSSVQSAVEKVILESGCRFMLHDLREGDGLVPVPNWGFRITYSNDS